MLKTNNVYFFDSLEFEGIIQYYIDAGKSALAKKALALGLGQHPMSVALKLLDAEILIFDDKYTAAIEILETIQAMEPTNEEVYIQKATIYSKTNDHKKALVALNIALDYSDDKADVYGLLGMEYLFLNNFSKARESFIACLMDDLEDYSSLYNVVYCFDMENMHVEAIAFLNTYIDKDPYSEVAWHQLGRQHFVLDEFDEALRAFDYAVLVDELFVGAYIEKAKTLEKLGRYKEAIDNYKTTLELEDATSFALLRIGECYLELKDNENALQFYKRTVHEDPLLDKGWMALSSIYYQQKDYEKSLYYINKALDIDQVNTAYLRRFGEINIKLSFYEEAVKVFELCIELGDDDVDIRIALVDVHYFLGDYELALACLEEADTEIPNTAAFNYRLACLHFLFETEEKGVHYLKKGLALDFDYHELMKEMYPAVFDLHVVQDIVSFYKFSF
ncbi:MAG: tetratricopeptide repeat protein [Flavobacteriaceae bacterium]|nr:tetratricopeptide repeat protein [Flavobacteriaceae bacterium]